MFNNPYVIAATIVVVLFTIFMVIRLIQEYRLNKTLQTKHKAMRIKQPTKNITKRMGLLGGVSFVPATALVIVLLINFVGPGIQENDSLYLEDKQDFFDLYNDFVENVDPTLRESTNDDVETPSDSEHPDQGAEGDWESPLVKIETEGMAPQGMSYTDGTFDYEIVMGELKISLSVQDMTTSYYDFTEVDDSSCEYSFYPIGMYLVEESLIVLGHDFSEYCGIYTDYTSEELYNELYGSNNLVVSMYVFDRSNFFEFVSEYTFSGTYIGSQSVNNIVYVFTTTYVPLGEASVELDDYLQGTSYDTMQQTAEYSDILTFEGVFPNAYVSLFAVDVLGESVDIEVVLIDNEYLLAMTDTNITLSGNVYSYETDEVKSGVISFTFIDGDIVFEEFIVE